MKKIILLLSLSFCIPHIHALNPDELKKQQEIENDMREYMTSFQEEIEILGSNPKFMTDLENACKSLFTKAQQLKQECKTKGQEDVTLCQQYYVASKKYREYKETLLSYKHIDIKTLIMLSAMQEMVEAVEGQKAQPNHTTKKPSQLFSTAQ